MKKRIIFPILCFVVFSFPISATRDSIQNRFMSFVEDINTFSMYVPQEKVYLHTDNTDYFLGETIWFKAYVVTSGLHQPTNLSKVLYVELLTPEGEVALTQKYEINNGRSHGRIYLDTRTFYSGFYELRAYTRYMTSFDKEVVYSRIFPVYSFPEEGNYEVRKITGSEIKCECLREKEANYQGLNIEFFPEGGSLTVGLNNRIAFKVTDKDGKSIDATGSVYNSKKEIVTDFFGTTQWNGCFFFSA